ncbi:MFS transporter [Neobacillus drentensis]|uniref:MFS transporter n=1 Tax=Neobacillus drentensis TaxID=220684 RepID=UPI002FFDC5A1
MKGKHIVSVSVFFITMLTLAVSDSLRGILLPIYENSFSLGKEQSSALVGISYGGVLVFTLLAGQLGKRLKAKKVIQIGLLIFILSLLLMTIAKSYIALILSIFFITGSAAYINIYLNITTPLVFALYQGILLNLLHFFYGLGVSLSQTGIGYFLSTNDNWRIIYLMLAIVSILILAIYHFIDVPTLEVEMGTKNHSIGWKEIIFSKTGSMLILLLGFYFIAEHGTMNYFVSYTNEILGMNFEISTSLLSLFFVLITVGRLFGGYLMDKFNIISVLFLCSIFGSFLYIFGVVFTNKGALLISSSGLFFSIIYPGLILLIKEYFPKAIVYATSIIVSAATIFDIIFNFAFGHIVNLLTFNVAIYLFPFGIIMVSILLFRLKNFHKSEMVIEVT